jgi:hypothetical protein
MKDMDAARRAAEYLLGDFVHFVFGTDGRPLRAVVGKGRRARFMDPDDWEQLWQKGLLLPRAPTPAPLRSRREDACPCPGCGLCVCRFVGDGYKRCKRSRCICPRLRVPVRLGLRRVNGGQVDLELRRGDHVLCTLGVWTPTTAWDFTAAGDAKRLSMPRAVTLLLHAEQTKGRAA